TVPDQSEPGPKPPWTPSWRSWLPTLEIDVEIWNHCPTTTGFDIPPSPVAVVRWTRIFEFGSGSGTSPAAGSRKTQAVTVWALAGTDPAPPHRVTPTSKVRCAPAPLASIPIASGCAPPWCRAVFTEMPVTAVPPSPALQVNPQSLLPQVADPAPKMGGWAQPRPDVLRLLRWLLRFCKPSVYIV